MAFKGLAHHLYDVEKRRSEREPVRFRTHMSIGGRARFGADMLNISRFGCMIRTAAIVGEGQLVSIELPTMGDVEARVAWAMGSRIGLEFEKDVDPAAFFFLIESLPRT